MDLGAPIGGSTTNARAGDQGEHGAGTGLSGGHGIANAANTQHVQQGSGFNHGLGGEHASGGIPSHGQHPIADKFTSGYTGSASGANLSGGKLDNSLDNYGGEAHSGSHHGAGAAGLGGAGGLAGAGALGAGAAGLSGRNVPSGDGVSGAYAGSGAQDALTGESHAQRTGAGVGPLGENTSSGLTGGHSGSHIGREGAGDGPYAENATAGSTGGAAALGAGAVGGAGAAGLGSSLGHHGQGHETSNLATAKSGVDTRGVDPSTYGTGVGAAGGAGGHVSSHDDSSRSHESGAGAATAGAAGAAGAGAAAAGGRQGHFGTAEKDFDRGAPVSDPSQLDSGGRHGLVFNEATGKYVHRHELDEGKATR